MKTPTEAEMIDKLADVLRTLHAFPLADRIRVLNAALALFGVRNQEASK